MDTAQIVRQCRRLPGVTVREGEDYTELLLSAAKAAAACGSFPCSPG